MLSSVAERVYWLGRYLERVENSARLMDVYSSMLFDLPGGTEIGWGILLDITGSTRAYEEKNKSINEVSVVKFLLADQSNSTSIFSGLKMLRENARTTREIIPSEAWEQINDLYLHSREAISTSIGRQARRNLFDEIISDCQRLGGLLSGCMSHNTAYTFIQLGRGIERSDMTTRIVDVGSISLLPAFAAYRKEASFLEPFENVVWMNILRSLSGYQAYRQNVANRVKGEAVVRFLLQDNEFPRSVNYCLEAMNGYLEQLPNHEDVLRAVVRVKRITAEANVFHLLEKGLLEFVDELQISIGDIHDELSRTWFGTEYMPEDGEADLSDAEIKPRLRTPPPDSPVAKAPARSVLKKTTATKTGTKAKVKTKTKAKPAVKNKAKPKAKK